MLQCNLCQDTDNWCFHCICIELISMKMMRYREDHPEIDMEIWGVPYESILDDTERIEDDLFEYSELIYDDIVLGPVCGNRDRKLTTMKEEDFSSILKRIATLEYVENNKI